MECLVVVVDPDMTTRDLLATMLEPGDFDGWRKKTSILNSTRIYSAVHRFLTTMALSLHTKTFNEFSHKGHFRMPGEVLNLIRAIPVNCSKLWVPFICYLQFSLF